MVLFAAFVFLTNNTLKWIGLLIFVITLPELIPGQRVQPMFLHIMSPVEFVQVIDDLCGRWEAVAW